MDYKWTALTVTTVGSVLTGISGRIVVVGLPIISQQLHAGAEQIVWITQAYILAATISLLIVGRVGDLFGRVKLFTFGFAIFTLGSVLAAVSFNSYELILFRLVQGAGVGIVLTNSSAIVTDASPRKELGMMLGINQTAYRMGGVSGLTLSGLVLSIFDWRGLFYVNIPIGIFGTVWAYRRLREISVKDPSRRMDWPGFALFGAGLSLVLLAVTYLSYGAAGLIEGVVLMLAGLFLLAAFVKVELTVASPMLDPRLFRIRSFAAGNLAQLLNSLCWGGIVLLLAFYLQVGLGYSALRAGLGLIPLEGTYLFSSLLGGKLSDKYSARVLTTTGLFLISVGFFALSTFGAEVDYPEFAAVLALIGVGNGLFTPPNLRAIMGSVPVNRIGIASGFRNLMFNMGVTVSYGLVILFLTLGIPYDTFSLLLQGIAPQSMLALAKAQFIDGFRIAVLLLAIIEVVAIIPSAMRASERATAKAAP